MLNSAGLVLLRTPGDSQDIAIKSMGKVEEKIAGRAIQYNQSKSVLFNIPLDILGSSCRTNLKNGLNFNWDLDQSVDHAWGPMMNKC